MADITLRLIWYRMGESYKNMAERCDRFLDWYGEFSWRRVDILDMLFLGWLLAAFVVVGAINLYLRFFGLPRSRKGLQNDPGRFGGSVVLSKGETCQWFNAALSWFYLHYDTTPEFIDAWIRALNEQSRKHTCQNGLQIKFERVHSGSLPPKVTCIKTDPASKETLDLYANVEATDTTLLVSAIQNTATNLKVTSCDVNLIKLQGQLRVHGNHSQETVQTTLTFTVPPEVQLTISTREYDAVVDKVEVERVVRASLDGATVSVNLSSLGGYPTYNSPSPLDQVTAQNKNFMTSGQLSPQRRLLVKVIKANGLGDKDFACSDPYCTIQMDQPPQTHTTSVVKNTVNPFWDEHFLFDFDNTSKQVKFEVYDREKPTGDDFLGRAMISLDELKRLPSSRQIVPLTGRPRATTTTSGSVTVEFTFVDAGDTAIPGNAANASDALSPRRRIETNTRVTPGGTHVTTTTTTTEKQKDQQLNPFYNESPNRIERPDTMSYNVDYVPYNSKGSTNLEAHDAALSHSPASTLSRGHTKGGATIGPGSPRLMVTRPDMLSEPPTPVPIIKMQEAGPRDETRDTLSMSTTSSDMHKAKSGRKLENAQERKSRPTNKKKSTFASAFKKRFSRPKKRSQSADRAFSSSFKEGSLLKPPEHADPGTHSKTAEDVDHSATLQEGNRGNLRKSRSQSFSNSLRRLFKKKKSKDGVSRESSLSRASGQASREGSVSHPSPHMSYREGDYRQDSPGPEYSNYSYSSSMPASASPLSHQH